MLKRKYARFTEMQCGLKRPQRCTQL